MTDLRKAAEMALEALENWEACENARAMLTHEGIEQMYLMSDAAITALRAALERPEPMRPTMQETQNAAMNLELMRKMFGGPHD